MTIKRLLRRFNNCSKIGSVRVMHIAVKSTDYLTVQKIDDLQRRNRASLRAVVL